MPLRATVQSPALSLISRISSCSSVLHGASHVRRALRSYRRLLHMATPARISLSRVDAGVFHVPDLDLDAAETASRLLQRNHEDHHIFFNKAGFHNHIAHHLVTAFALGAQSATLQGHYDRNKSYQRPQSMLDESVVKAMSEPGRFRQYLGKEQHYNNFRIFFRRQSEGKGWETVLNEYLFKRDERADDLLGRAFAGLLHPLIHLGFGVEFKQPAIIVEALAQAAVHSGWMTQFLLEAEKAAGDGTPADSKPVVQLLDEIYEDSKLSRAARWDDENKIRDGVIKRAGTELIDCVSQYKVHPKDLEEKVAEMINAAAYFTGAAQRRTKQIKFDFYLIHCVNASIFYSAFIKQPWISPEDKVRLLEWKVRSDLAMYASRRSPEPVLDEIINYKPQRPSGDQAKPWENIFERVVDFPDDGHASKLARVLAHGEQICAPYEGNEHFRIKKDMWLQLGHMAIDSVEAAGDHWVRSAGFDEAWEEVGNRYRDSDDVNSA